MNIANGRLRSKSGKENARISAGVSWNREFQLRSWFRRQVDFITIKSKSQEMTHEEILMAMLLIAVVFLLATKLLPEPKPRDLSRGQALKDTPSDHVAKESKPK